MLPPSADMICGRAFSFCLFNVLFNATDPGLCENLLIILDLQHHINALEFFRTSNPRLTEQSKYSPCWQAVLVHPVAWY